jgi:phospholipase/lecithinase/hemolysin
MFSRAIRSILFVFLVLTMFVVGDTCVLQAHAATPTNTLLQLSANTVPSGTAVTLTASVTANGAAVSPGQVTFCDAAATFCEDEAVLGTAQLTSKGSASIRLTLGIGTHSIKAVFAGTTADTGSISAAQSLIVTGKHSTTTAITSAGNPGKYTLTATVKGTGDGTAEPSGNVSFLDTSNGNALLGTAPLGTSTLSQALIKSSSFDAVGNSGTTTTSVAVGDFNGDGKPDLAVVNEAGVGNDSVGVLLGNGDGTFQNQVGYAVGVGGTSVAVGDFNGDGRLDLVVTNYSDNTVSVLLGNGDGTFQNQVAYSTGKGPGAVAVGDFNGDGKPDLVVANRSDNTVSVLLGNGAGGFQNQVAYPVGNFPLSIAAGDLNGNGKLDLVVTNLKDGTLSVLSGNGDGTFQNQVVYPVGEESEFVALGDFNGDGKPDLAVTIATFVAVLLNNGDGTFQSPVTYPTDESESVVVADFNGDGKPDLAVSNGDDSTVSVLLGNGNGTFQSRLSYFGGFFLDAMAVGDFNGDGNPDVAVLDGRDEEGGGWILLNQVTQTATATLSNISVPGTGTQLADATYAGDTNYAGSVSGTVPLLSIHPIATQTTLTASASTVPSGTPVTLTATVTANGTAVSPGQVNFCDAAFASCTGSPVLGTAQLASNGIATLKLILGVGEHSIKAVFPGTAANAGNGSLAYAGSTSPVITINITAVVPPPPTAINQVIAFGDSLLDTGTYQQFAKANFNGGEFTTNPGKLFIQDVAATYGNVLIPAFQGGFGRPLASSGGFDYAEGGSRVSEQPGIGHDTSEAQNAAYSEETTIPVAEQLTTYLDTYQRFHPNQLVIIDGGANDIFFNLAAAEQAGTPAALQAAQQAIVQSAIDLAGVVNTVIAKGATHVAVMNVPDLGTTPQGIASADHGKSLTQIAQLFNTTLIAQLQSNNLTNKVVLLDVYSLVDNVVANFKGFGFKVSNTGTACNAQAEIAEATALKLTDPGQFSDSLFCSPATYTTPTAPEDFVFADTVHPSTHLSSIVATAVEKQLASSALMQ